MLDAAAVDELASFDSDGAPVLSIYLGLDPFPMLSQGQLRVQVKVLPMQIGGYLR